MKRLIPHLLSATLVYSGLNAQEALPSKTPDPNAWSVRTCQVAVFDLPMDEMPPSLIVPPPDASESDMVTFLKHSTEVVSKILAQHRLTFPEGTLFSYDPASTTLAIRTTGALHERLQSLVHELNLKLSSHATLRLDLMEADADSIRLAVKEAAKQDDHTAILAGLEKLADQGKARWLHTMNLQTRSGQRAKVSSTEDFQEIAGFSLDEKNHAALDLDTIMAGTSFEIDPVIAEDHRYIDLNFALRHHFAPPTQRWEAAHSNGLRRIESRVTDEHSVSINSCFKLPTKSTKLLGIWETEAGVPQTLQAAFLRGNIVLVRPALNLRVEEVIKRYGEKVTPTPAPIPPAVEQKIPPGMVLRRYPAKLFEGNEKEKSSDPLSETVPKPEVGKAENTVVEVLKSLGVELTDGATAYLEDATGKLVLVDTPQRHDYFEKVFADMDDGPPPPGMCFTLQIVQADAKFLRRLESETTNLADHTAAWNSIEKAAAAAEQVKFLRTAWIETRSGQRAEFTTGEVRRHSTGIQLGEQAFASKNSESESHPEGDQPKETNDGKQAGKHETAGVESGARNPIAKISGKYEIVNVGTSLEIDPVLDEDLKSVYLSIDLRYDYAPPSLSPELALESAKTLRLEAPATHFHRMSLKAAMTMLVGQPRLVALWKPNTLPGSENKDVLQAAFIRVDLTGLKSTTTE